MTGHSRKSRSTRRLIRGVSGLALVLLLAACATPARVDQMTIDTPDARRTAVASSSAMRNAVAIGQVGGGKETNPLWVSNIASADFEAALRASLRSAGLLAIDPTNCRVQLDAQLLSLAQPMVGASMTVTASVLYRLVDCVTKKEVWVRTITLPYTAAFTDSLLGVERLKLANEGAARVNIKQLVAELAEFKPQ
jgi:hypothetical protein